MKLQPEEKCERLCSGEEEGKEDVRYRRGSVRDMMLQLKS